MLVLREMWKESEDARIIGNATRMLVYYVPLMTQLDRGSPNGRE